MKCIIKGDPSKLPVPKLPPTKPVDIGTDKMSYIPSTQTNESKSKEWSVKDERILIKLKRNGVKDKEIAKRTGRSLSSVKWKIKALRSKGVEL